MIIDLVFKTGISCGIGTGLAFEHDGASVRQNKPGPDQEYAGLPKRDLAVVTADQSRALRNQQRATRRRIKDGIGHLRGDLPRQIRAEARDECRGNKGDLYRRGIELSGDKQCRFNRYLCHTSVAAGRAILPAKDGQGKFRRLKNRFNLSHSNGDLF